MLARWEATRRRTRSGEPIDAYVTAVNPSVAHVLATSSSSGHAVVFDLKNKREVCSLSYTGSGANQLGQQGWTPQGMGGRKAAVSAVAWHPENPTKLVTASEDDANPIIMLWDLRQAMAPERVRSEDSPIVDARRSSLATSKACSACRGARATPSSCFRAVRISARSPGTRRRARSLAKYVSCQRLS